MAINVSLANSQACNIRGYCNRLNSINNSINNMINSIDYDWQSDETGYMNTNIDSTARSISELVTKFQTLSGDIITSANETKQEEVKEEQAAAQARTKKS